MNEQNKLITTNHDAVIKNHIKNAKKSIKIISPFISFKSLDFINETNTDITIITKFDINDFIQGASSINCLYELLSKKNVKIYAIKDLHTKLYIFDNETAIVGSVNFTDGGFNKNIELSVEFVQSNIINDINKYFDEELSIAKNYVITQDLIAKYLPYITANRETKRQTEKFEDIFNKEDAEDNDLYEYKVIRTNTVSKNESPGEPTANKPVYIILGENEPIKCDSQKDMLSKFLVEIDKLYPNRLNSIVQSMNNNNIDNSPLTKRSPRIIKKDIAIETNMSWRNKAIVILKVLENLSLPLGYYKYSKPLNGDISVTLKRKNNKEIVINADTITRIIDKIKQSDSKLKQYKLSDFKRFSNLLNENITFSDYIDLNFYYKDDTNPIIIELNKNRGKKDHLENFIFTIIQQDFYKEIEKLNIEINHILNNYNKISFNNEDAINFKFFKAIEENFPNCNFRIDINEKCIYKKYNN